MWNFKVIGKILILFTLDAAAMLHRTGSNSGGGWIKKVRWSLVEGTGPVQCSHGLNKSGTWMVWFLNVIWIPDRKFTNRKYSDYCIFWPAFKFCTLQVLVKICFCIFLHIFTRFWCENEEKLANFWLIPKCWSTRKCWSSTLENLDLLGFRAIVGLFWCVLKQVSYSEH